MSCLDERCSRSNSGLWTRWTNKHAKKEEKEVSVKGSCRLQRVLTTTEDGMWLSMVSRKVRKKESLVCRGGAAESWHSPQPLELRIQLTGGSDCPGSYLCMYVPSQSLHSYRSAPALLGRQPYAPLSTVVKNGRRRWSGCRFTVKHNLELGLGTWKGCRST